MKEVVELWKELKERLEVKCLSIYFIFFSSNFLFHKLEALKRATSSPPPFFFFTKNLLSIERFFYLPSFPKVFPFFELLSYLLFNSSESQYKIFSLFLKFCWNWSFFCRNKQKKKIMDREVENRRGEDLLSIRTFFLLFSTCF